MSITEKGRHPDMAGLAAALAVALGALSIAMAAVDNTRPLLDW